MAVSPFAGGLWGSQRGGGGGGSTTSPQFVATTAGAFEIAVAVANVTGGQIYLKPGATYTLVNPVTINNAKMGITGSYSKIDCSALSGQTALTIDYQSTPDQGPTSRRAKAAQYMGFELTGPGDTNAGSFGIYINSSTPTVGSTAPRPVFIDVFINNFETGIGGQDRFFLAEFHGCEVYQCTTAIWQKSGIDAGENCSFHGGVIHHCNLLLRIDDASGEWNFYGTSMNYSNQLVLATVSARISLHSCHVEFRGGSLDGSTEYILNGSGSDIRAVVAGKDSWIDLDGDGTTFWMHGGLIDLNNGNGAVLGPYNYWHLVNVRHVGSKAFFKNVYATNTANTANRFWTGLGKCFPGIVSRSSTPANITRASDQQATNAYADYGYTQAATAGIRAAALGVQQNLFLSLDTGDSQPYSTVATAPVGSFTASVTGNVMTVTAMTSGTIGKGCVITTVAGLAAGTYITGMRADTVGGVGVYYLSASGTVASTAMSTTGSARVFDPLTGTNGTVAIATPPAGHDAISATSTISGLVATIQAPSQGRWTRGMVVTGTGVTAGTRIVGVLPVNITASCATNVLTVTATDGPLAVGQLVIMQGVASGTTIASLGTGTGGTGTYVLSTTPGTLTSRVASAIAQAGGAGKYLVDISQTVASTTLTGTVAKAVKFSKLVTTTGSTGRCRFSVVVPITKGAPFSSLFQTLLPTTGAMAGANIFASLSLVTMAASPDSNGIPQIAQRLTSSASIAVNIATTGYWIDQVLPQWSTSGPTEALDSATHVEIQFNADSVTTAGDMYFTFPHGTFWA